MALALLRLGNMIRNKQARPRLRLQYGHSLCNVIFDSIWGLSDALCVCVLYYSPVSCSAMTESLAYAPLAFEQSQI